MIKKYKSQKIKKKRNYLITYYCVLPKKYCVREMFYDVNFVFIVSIYLKIRVFIVDTQSFCHLSKRLNIESFDKGTLCEVKRFLLILGNCFVSTLLTQYFYKEVIKIITTRLLGYIKLTS